jgi:molecular chaperone DnaK (HSP70)
MGERFHRFFIRCGAKLTSIDFVESTPMETILTVPAVWSDKAKSDTLQCAHQAGFGEMDKIRLITEPEAAAVYTFHQVCKPKAPLLNVLT